MANYPVNQISVEGFGWDKSFRKEMIDIQSQFCLISKSSQDYFKIRVDDLFLTRTWRPLKMNSWRRIVWTGLLRPCQIFCSGFQIGPIIFKDQGWELILCQSLDMVRPYQFCLLFKFKNDQFLSIAWYQWQLKMSSCWRIVWTWRRKIFCLISNF